MHVDTNSWKLKLGWKILGGCDLFGPGTLKLAVSQAGVNVMS